MESEVVNEDVSGKIMLGGEMVVASEVDLVKMDPLHAVLALFARPSCFSYVCAVWLERF